MKRNKNQDKNILFGAITFAWSTTDGFTPFGREGIRFVADRPLTSAIWVVK